jgi:hypothetical protein
MTESPLAPDSAGSGGADLACQEGGFACGTMGSELEVDTGQEVRRNGRMSSLTSVLDDSSNPVAQWMRQTFPNPRSLLADIRKTAGTTVLHAPRGIAYTTQGGAIDWWIRFLTVPGSHPALRVARKGLEALDGYPAGDAGWPMFSTATDMTINADMEINVDITFDEPVEMMRRLLEMDAEHQARTCFVLSLFTECFRAGVRPGSRLLTVPEGAGVPALLNLATATEVADLIVMRDSAQHVFLPELPQGLVYTGPTFDGSRYLPADADLIVGDLLVEMKSTIGGQPRKDGTRAVKFERKDLYQLLGYLLMDFSDRYGIRQVGLYAIRFESFQTWKVDQFLEAAAGRPLDLVEARQAFKQVLHDKLPAYMSARYGVDWEALRGIGNADDRTQ